LMFFCHILNNLSAYFFHEKHQINAEHSCRLQTKESILQRKKCKAPLVLLRY
jgi:hypothetical protein